MFVHAAAAGDVMGELEVYVWSLLFDCFKDFHGLFHYFRANVVTREDEDAVGLG